MSAAAVGAFAETTRKFPVVEVFGPTIQGEGPLAGLPTYFVRFGGCDYRCSWCDSLHAVLPELVRENAEKLTMGDILARLDDLPRGPRWVTLSGGNPAMLKLSWLVRELHRGGYKVTVETQGSVWRDWLDEVDVLTVSPKPPSSGMAGKTANQLEAFMRLIHRQQAVAVKVVVFDDVDYEWAKTILLRYPQHQAFLSAGTRSIEQEPLTETARRYRWLCEKVAADTGLAHVRVLPQLHVVAWGHKLGV